MSHEIPVFSFAVEWDRLPPDMDCDQALRTAPESSPLWMATSRNWWYQGLLQRTLEAYTDFAELKCLLLDLALVPREQTGNVAGLLRALLVAISEQPQAFSRLDYTDENHQAIQQQVSEAQVLRKLDDHSSLLAHSNFFSYLLSLAAALEEAEQSGKAFLSVQFKP